MAIRVANAGCVLNNHTSGSSNMSYITSSQTLAAVNLAQLKSVNIHNF
jgi:hypothetical protein